MLNYTLWDGSEKGLYEFNELLNDVYPSRRLSDEYFVWKHLKNPLGKSIITFAHSNDGVLVGARALQFGMYESNKFCQPCDTVTHGEFRRMGIFSSLTKLAVEEVGDKIPVINFPNNNSLPAYLKLGWKFHTKLMPKLFFSPGAISCSLLSRATKEKALEEVDKIGDKVWRDFCKWRFFDNPLQSYRYYKVDSGIAVMNKRRNCFTINFSCDQALKKSNRGPFLAYTYSLNKKNGGGDVVFSILGKKGINFTSKKDDDFLDFLVSEGVGVSGLMDTF